MSRSQDTVIDDDEESCPLCIEEFDLSDKNFRPCPCGYQICQFCFNSLKTTYEKSTCPNCRRPYDESTIQYKIPTAEELKMDQMNKNKKLAAARRKETEKREVETSSRRNLAGVRVKQQNLVYVIGLEPTKKDESSLMDTLRGKDYFGQYGPIEKIVVSKPKPGAVNQGVGVYVTFKNKEDAALCIECVDGSQNGEKILRAQFGTTKYCSTFLRGETCQNKNCSFLHETGEDGQNTSLQNEPIETKKPFIPRSQPTPQPSSASQSMARQLSLEGSDSRKGSQDGSALPATAGWANAPIARARRASQATSNPSPQLTHTALSIQKTESPAPPDPPVQTSMSVQSEESSQESSQSSQVSESKASPVPVDSIIALWDFLKQSALANNLCFIYDDSWLSAEERSKIADLPPLCDPYGGAKRRLMADREAEARAKTEDEEKNQLEEQAKSAAEDAMDEDNMASGSLALGGEPEENSRSTSARGTIGRPAHQSPSPGLVSGQFVNMNLGNRSMTPQQQRQLAILSSGGAQPGSRLAQPTNQNTAFEMSDFDRRGPQYSQAQYDQISSHARHGSRYFNNESKSSSGTRYPGQQQPFFTSGVQGPPPGLPTAGTPPISGGGMFAHGVGFTSSGFGTSKDVGSDAMRTRSGTNVGHDAKRGGVEHLADPSIVSARIHPSNTTSGQSLFGGNQAVDHDKDFPPLPFRNDTQSVVHSRVSSVQSLGSGAGRSGTPRVPPGFERTSTPRIPPGLENFHAHQDSGSTGKPTNEQVPSHVKETSKSAIAPVVPAVPLVLADHHSQPPKLDEIPNNQANDAPEPNNGLQEDLSRDREAATDTDLPKRKPTNKPKQAVRPEDEGAKLENSLSRADHENPTLQQATKADEKGYGIDKINTSVEPVKISAPVMEVGVVSSPGASSSRSGTPATSASDAKRPRTLRLTTEMIQKAQKTENAAMTSTATEKSGTYSGVANIRQESRQPSISTSRPSTPTGSEQMMSQDVSRAGSPPASLAGAVLSRSKTKNQLKKERREKAKKVAENGDADGTSTQTASNATTSTADPIGPIVARQKKQKKQKTNKADDGTRSMDDNTEREEISTSQKKTKDTVNDNRQPSPVKKSSIEPDPPMSPEPEILEKTNMEKVVSEKKEVYTLRDLYNDASKLQSSGQTYERVLQKLLAEHTSPMSKLLPEMIASGDIGKDHPWFTPQSFSSAAYRLPPDNRKGQDYLDGNGYSMNDAFGYVYLPQKEKRALYNGHAVSVADNGERKNDLLRRCLITPNGWVMRHLSAEESEKVLDLEERRGLYVEEHGEIGIMNGLGVLEQDDFINLGGGFEELARFGDRHGVCWVMGDRDAAESSQQDDGEASLDGLGEIIDEVELLDEGLSDETDEDVAVDFADTAGSMPGAWDPAFSSSHADGRDDLALSISGMPPNTLPPIQGQHGRNINLRAMDIETLQKRSQEKHKETDGARKDAEKAEKFFAKKSKDHARWRESIFKSAQEIA